jgi:uncharacterized protein with HEPN domain
MPSENRDLAYLWDMREAAREIVQFVEGMKWAKFESDKVVRYAVERQLLVIGEAANHVSDQFRKEHPEIPWGRIIGQRNVLAHEYGEILVERIWVAATKSIPELLELLKPLISEE